MFSLGWWQWLTCMSVNLNLVGTHVRWILNLQPSWKGHISCCWPVLCLWPSLAQGGNHGTRHALLWSARDIMAWRIKKYTETYSSLQFCIWKVLKHLQCHLRNFIWLCIFVILCCLKPSFALSTSIWSYRHLPVVQRAQGKTFCCMAWQACWWQSTHSHNLTSKYGSLEKDCSSFISGSLFYCKLDWLYMLYTRILKSHSSHLLCLQ